MNKLLAILGLLLAGCEPSELRMPVFAPVGGGSSAPAPARPAATPIAPGAHRIDNPDEPITHQMIDYVWGNSLEEAADQCKRIAASAGVRYSHVQRTSQRGNKWECHVIGNHPEPEPYYDDRNYPRYRR